MANNKNIKKEIFMKIKRVFFICDFAANYGGNFLASLQDLTSLLLKKNIFVEYVFPEEAYKKKWEIKLKASKIVYVKKNELREFINKNIKSGDLIHTHFLSIRQLLNINLALKGKSNVHVIVHEHMDLDPIHGNLYQLLKQVICKTFLNNFTYIGVSYSVYKRLRNIYGDKNVYLIENAISTSRLDMPDNNPFEGTSKKHAIIFGTDYNRKGVDLAIEAIKNNVELSKKVELDVIATNVKDTKLRIKNQFGDGVFSFVKVMNTDPQVQNFYNNSFVFLSPSRHEAFGYANVEAAYCGTQVIISDVPGQNILKKIPHIMCIESENVASLEDSIIKALKTPNNIILEEAKENREYIIRNFSLENWSKKVYGVYKNVVN